MIESERLFFRPFELEDLDIVLDLYGNEKVMEYVPFPIMDKEMAREQLNKNIEGWSIQPQINYELCVIIKDSNRKIGRAEITRYYEDNSAMIGWMLIESAWRQGYATEIAKTLIEYCFEKLNVHRVFALCHPNNVGSYKTMEKNGMIKEGHFKEKREYIRLEGNRWEDELEYAIINKMRK